MTIARPPAGGAAGSPQQPQVPLPVGVRDLRAARLDLAARMMTPGSDGVARRRAVADLVVGALALLWTEATEGRDVQGVALGVVGSVGRGDASPVSDLDLLLVHDVKPRKVAKEIEPLASALWYPLWDAGVKLGHAVRRIDEQLELAGTDLDSATALLTARPLAGDDTLAAALVEIGRASCRERV